MRLSDFTATMRRVSPAGRGDPAILGLASDSREVGEGFLFAALPGSGGDGADYIPDAVKNGAAALLVQDIPRVDPGVPYLIAEDARKALGEAADIFYDHPSRSLDLIGVTGTNGKTTTACLLRHIFTSVGRKTGMLGTIEYDLGNRAEPAPLTTPGAVRFARSLAEMRDFGCAVAVVEASSHALDQDRVFPHRFAGAVFTNLTRDHLDYHGGMDAYREAKRKLFLSLDERAVAVLNFGDPAAPRIAEGCAAKILGYSMHGGAADAAAVEIMTGSLDGQTFRIRGCGMDREFHTPLVGRHNVENCAGAILLALGMGIRPHSIAEAVAGFPGVPGRLERIESPGGARAFVDYAHTDDALKSAASVLKPLVRGKLITVFGCGGDRDPGKRPLMAKAAEAFSDVVVVTSDNPRTEDPEKIIDAVMAGFARPERVIRIADRPVAVRKAVGMAGPDDAVLVAGKGHEDYQIVGAEKRHMDDRELVRGAFAMARRDGGKDGKRDAQ
jgi:UDP-N-acetylmuramoyl-L-alanyl-D-glutamate--2,6-diaminopimelate ligase